MSKHLEHDLAQLEQSLLAQAASAEEGICKAVLALQQRNVDLAEKVFAAAIDQARKEIQVENECLKTLALHQPVAVDLRRVIGILKINSHLSRMSDLAVNIAERVQALTLLEEMAIPDRLQNLADLAIAMVRKSLDSFLNADARLAAKVILLDDEVDCINREIIEELIPAMQAVPRSVPAGISLFSAVRHLERIADHAGHIAEDVIYMVEGEIVGSGPHLARPHRSSVSRLSDSSGVG